MTVGKKKLPKGWTEGSVQDLLGLTDEEAAIVEMRVRLAEGVRERQRSQRITQKDLARRMRSAQPRTARLEQADASIEMLVQARCSYSLLTARGLRSSWQPESRPVSVPEPSHPLRVARATWSRSSTPSRNGSASATPAAMRIPRACATRAIARAGSTPRPTFRGMAKRPVPAPISIARPREGQSARTARNSDA